MATHYTTDGTPFIVDDADDALVAATTWRARRPDKRKQTKRRRSLTYIVTADDRMIRLHRLLLGIVDDPTKYGDHVNGDTLDNRRANLRAVTPQESAWNRAGWKGAGAKCVFWVADRQRWRVRLELNGRKVHIGYFEDETEAREAARQALAHHHGAFAR